MSLLNDSVRFYVNVLQHIDKQSYWIFQKSVILMLENGLLAL